MFSYFSLIRCIQMLIGIGMSRLRRSLYCGWHKGTTFVALWTHGVSRVSVAIENLHAGSAISAMSLWSATNRRARKQRLQSEEELCTHWAARTAGAIQQWKNSGIGTREASVKSVVRRRWSSHCCSLLHGLRHASVRDVRYCHTFI